MMIILLYVQHQTVVELSLMKGTAPSLPYLCLVLCGLCGGVWVDFNNRQKYIISNSKQLIFALFLSNYRQNIRYF